MLMAFITVTSEGITNVYIYKPVVYFKIHIVQLNNKKKSHGSARVGVIITQCLPVISVSIRQENERGINITVILRNRL